MYTHSKSNQIFTNLSDCIKNVEMLANTAQLKQDEQITIKDTLNNIRITDANFSDGELTFYPSY